MVAVVDLGDGGRFVFISYSRADAADLAHDIERYFRPVFGGLGLEAWFDAYNIPAGDDWARPIDEGVVAGSVAATDQRNHVQGQP